MADKTMIVTGAFLGSPLHDAARFAVDVGNWRCVPTTLRIVAARCDLGNGNPRSVTEISNGGDVRRTEQVGQSADDMGVVYAGTAAEGDSLSAVYLADSQHFLGDHVECFIPAGSAPLAFSAFTNPDHWVIKPIRVIKLFDARCASLGAKSASIDRVVLVAKYPFDGTFDQLDDSTTAAMAHPTDRFECTRDPTGLAWLGMGDICLKLSYRSLLQRLRADCLNAYQASNFALSDTGKSINGMWR